VTATIYVEGGGHSDNIRSRCREGFRSYCQKLVSPRARLKIVACGGREEAFERFIIQIQSGADSGLCALLVDSEVDVEPGTTIAGHLYQHDKWTFPDLGKNELFLMVQAMEAWFLADRAALIRFYGSDFRLSALRGDDRQVESIRKDDLVACLVSATRATKGKGSYHKTKHGFPLLAEIDPLKVEDASPHAAEFGRFLRSL
jgi:hypothetical protein